jgi:hypothetical protein
MQVILGFLVATGMTSLRSVHVTIGVIGLLLLIGLTALALITQTFSVLSRLAVIPPTAIVITQVYIGFELLAGAEALAMLHEVTGLLVVAFLTITVLAYSSLPR